ncbi:hypothetical protein TRFO_00890 [Tritrichomonas foetus]|uniref:Uncharacterized protein n=1 Tax=Tritrichomonas foetus TaxID=1144522 RepID=A0A1J4L283_9EUKA|nr:hypothetical protein TRFO_00890 [Tritrichomonas foetus]|eukprot:OHT17623.1 hypothetical protein TRFO_00890 [Tritrichomonas foetus]
MFSFLMSSMSMYMLTVSHDMTVPWELKRGDRFYIRVTGRGLTVSFSSSRGMNIVVTGQSDAVASIQDGTPFKYVAFGPNLGQVIIEAQDDIEFTVAVRSASYSEGDEIKVVYEGKSPEVPSNPTNPSNPSKPYNPYNPQKPSNPSNSNSSGLDSFFDLMPAFFGFLWAAFFIGLVSFVIYKVIQKKSESKDNYENAIPPILGLEEVEDFDQYIPQTVEYSTNIQQPRQYVVPVYPGNVVIH